MGGRSSEPRFLSEFQHRPRTARAVVEPLRVRYHDHVRKCELACVVHGSSEVGSVAAIDHTNDRVEMEALAHLDGVGVEMRSG